MPKRRYVSDSFWSDPRIEDLDPLERYLYLYLLTNEHVGISGFYEIKLRRVAFETGLDSDMVKKILQRFQEAGKVFYNDNIIFIVNFVKNQSLKSTNDNLRKGIEREFNEFGREKTDKITLLEGAYKVVEGAYKDVPIPYFTLLYSTSHNGVGKLPSKKENIYRSFKHLSITTEEVEKLKEMGYPLEQINEILDSIENYSGNKKYTSLYLTARKRITKEKPREDKPKPMTASEVAEMYK